MGEGFAPNLAGKECEREAMVIMLIPRSSLATELTQCVEVRGV